MQIFIRPIVSPEKVFAILRGGAPGGKGGGAKFVYIEIAHQTTSCLCHMVQWVLSQFGPMSHQAYLQTRIKMCGGL